MLQKVDEGFKKFLFLVTGWMPSDASAAGANPDIWTIKDHIGHVASWHELLVAWIDLDARGMSCAIPGDGFTWKDLERFNDKLHSENQHKDYGEQLRRLIRSYLMLHDRLVRQNEERICAVNAYFFTTGGETLLEYVKNITWEHYEMHYQMLKDRDPTKVGK
jgi:hypothetical protein